MNDKNKDIIYTMLEMESMYRSITDAYADYQKRVDGMTPQERDRSTMIKVVQPPNFQEYIDKTMKTMAEDSPGDIVLMNCDEEVKRVRGVLKDYKPVKQKEK